MMRPQSTRRALLWWLPFLALGGSVLVFHLSRPQEKQNTDASAAAGAAAAPAAQTPSRPQENAPPRLPVGGGKVIPFRPQIVQDRTKAKGMLKMPDGSFVEPLNGVENPQPAQFRHGPYTPIVGKERVYWKGYGMIEWYVHADGTRSTTLMQDSIRFGKPVREPITIVAKPFEPGSPPQTDGLLPVPRGSKPSGVGESK